MTARSLSLRGAKRCGNPGRADALRLLDRRVAPAALLAMTIGGIRRSPLDEVLAREALRVEERSKVGVVDTRVRAIGDFGLGAIGDAEAG